MSSVAPTKPLLNGLKGAYEIPNDVHHKLDIEPGILTGGAKNWSSVDVMVQNYFMSLKFLSVDSQALLQQFKATFRKLETCNNAKLKEYAKKLTVYYDNNKICKQFHNNFEYEEVEFEKRKSEKRAVDQGIIVAGSLAIEGGLHLAKNSKKRIEASKSSEQLERDHSFGSDDYTPTTTNRTLILVEDSEDENKDEDVASDDSWFNDEFNLSAYLFDYRKQSIHLNTHKSDRELSPSRLLSLSHVFFFPADKKSSCIYDLEKSIIDTEYDNIHDGEVGLAQIPHTVSTYVDQIIDAYDSRNKFDIPKAFGQVLINASQSKDRDLLVTAAYIIIDVFKKIKHEHNTNTRRFNKRYGEDTFIHHFLTPWIDNVFHGEQYGCKWANAQLEAYGTLPAAASASATPIPSSSTSSAASSSSSPSPSPSPVAFKKKMYPDFKMYTIIKSTKFDLFVVEVKPPGSSLALYDQRKLGYELKKMIDHIIEAGFPSPVVCGLWVDGASCTSYKMDLKHSGVYRFVELDTFTIPTAMHEIMKVRYIKCAFMKMKTIIDTTATTMEDYAKMRRNSPTESPSNTKKRYIRTDQVKSARIKKQKSIN